MNWTDHEYREAMKSYLFERGASVSRPGKVCCPFHDDVRPSATWSVRFHCFACGVSASNVIWLISDREGVTYAEAKLRAETALRAADHELRGEPRDRTALPGIKGHQSRAGRTFSAGGSS